MRPFPALTLGIFAIAASGQTSAESSATKAQIGAGSQIEHVGGTFVRAGLFDFLEPKESPRQKEFRESRARAVDACQRSSKSASRDPSTITFGDVIGGPAVSETEGGYRVLFSFRDLDGWQEFECYTDRSGNVTRILRRQSRY